MNHRNHNTEFDENSLWQRILKRYRFRRGLLRGRVPLVFFRMSPQKEVRQVRTSASKPSSYVLNLQIQLAWPQWLVNAYGPRVSLEQSIYKASVIRELKTAWNNTKETNIVIAERSTITTREVVREAALPQKSTISLGSGQNHLAVVGRSSRSSKIDSKIAFSSLNHPLPRGGTDPTRPQFHTLEAKRAPREHSHAGAVDAKSSVASVLGAVSNFQSPPEPAKPANESTSAPVIIRHSTQTFVSSRRHVHFAERNGFTPIVLRTGTSVHNVFRTDAVQSAFWSSASVRNVFRTSASARSVVKNVAGATSKSVSNVYPTSYSRDERTERSSSTIARSFQTIERSFHTQVEPASFTQPTVPLSFLNRSPIGADEPGLLRGGRSRLYAQRPTLEFAKPSASASAERVQPQEQPVSHRAPASVAPPPPQLDIARLSDEVYEHIQRKIRVERERRGL